MCVCVCVCVCVYLVLLSHFLPFKIHLTNISPILIKIVDFKNLAWATSFATQASKKFIYLQVQNSSTCPKWKKVTVIPCSIPLLPCIYVYCIVTVVLLEFQQDFI